jgi:hypothetical protein
LIAHGTCVPPTDRSQTDAWAATMQACKVLFVEWSDDGEIDVTSFERGDWEARLPE